MKMRHRTVTSRVVVYITCGIGILFIAWIWTNQKLPFTSGADSRLACTIPKKPVDLSLKTTNNLTLRKLAEYETVCGGRVVDSLMLFAPMPQTLAEAKNFAGDVARTLKEFSAHSIPPVVVFEPKLESRSHITDIRNDIHDGVLTSYFETLKSLGIRDKDMGTWVLFPEANTPAWKTTDPVDFTANVTKVGSIQKSIFPNSEISILLNSYSYPSNDTEWSHGELKSLLPYIKGLPKGLVDSFGYQGFPSVAEANAPHQYELLDARDFLPTNLAAEAAKALGTNKIWLNTGSFSRIHTADPATEVHISPTVRRETLRTILRQARELKAQQFSVSINLFSENKSLTSERTDWSYWHSDTISQKSPDTVNFKWFVHIVHAEEMTFSLYDHI